MTEAQYVEQDLGTKIEKLRSEHRALDEELKNIVEDPSIDDLQLQRLKKTQTISQRQHWSPGKSTGSRHHRLVYLQPEENAPGVRGHFCLGLPASPAQ